MYPDEIFLTYSFLKGTSSLGFRNPELFFLIMILICWLMKFFSNKKYKQLYSICWRPITPLFLQYNWLYFTEIKIIWRNIHPKHFGYVLFHIFSHKQYKKINKFCWRPIRELYRVTNTNHIDLLLMFYI